VKSGFPCTDALSNLLTDFQPLSIVKINIFHQQLSFIVTAPVSVHAQYFTFFRAKYFDINW